jgi:putative addiction module component (TIGR02574 family)
MSMTLEQLRKEALSLPTDDRRQLMDSLWDSFEGQTSDDEAEFAPEYLIELDRRSADVEKGTAVMIPFDEAMRHISETIRLTQTERQR